MNRLFICTCLFFALPLYFQGVQASEEFKDQKDEKKEFEEEREDIRRVKVSKDWKIPELLVIYNVVIFVISKSDVMETCKRRHYIAAPYGGVMPVSRQRIGINFGVIGLGGDEFWCGLTGWKNDGSEQNNVNLRFVRKEEKGLEYFFVTCLETGKSADVHFSKSGLMKKGKKSFNLCTIC
ncbi:hypothetical protein ACFLY6_02895 [Candidatus Dependentiae bacterium]